VRNAKPPYEMFQFLACILNYYTNHNLKSTSTNEHFRLRCENAKQPHTAEETRLAIINFIL